MTTLVLIRGLPGSGKSTLAKSLGCLHVEADMFFMRDAVYQYDKKRIKQAHIWCLSTARMASGYRCDVVVSNTFTTIKEMEPYFGMVYDKLRVIKCVGDYGNVHDVPADVLKKMASRWEDYEGEEIYG
jgi:tRNA uridine 5-carbamoylmethylation protein Kti12